MEKAAKPLDRLRRWAIRGLLIFAVGSGVAGATLCALLLAFSHGLPSFRSLEDYHPPQVTRFVDRNGAVVAEIFEEKRTVVPLSRIPPRVRQAFLAAEDADFYRHPGMDLKGILRAALHNLLAGRKVEGGSTITQQVIKTFILGPEKSYARKIRELILAMRLETNLSKNDILALYLNQIFFGHQCHGVQEASRFLFDKDVSQISLEEAALLAALPKSPARYSPIRHPEAALERRNWVLSQMHKNGFITEMEARAARAQPLRVVGKSAPYDEVAPYYVEHCRQWLEERLGREALLRDGLRVELPLDGDLNRAAQRILSDGLRAVDRRQGFRGPLANLSADEVRSLRQRAGEGRHGRVWTLRHEAPEGAAPVWRARWIEIEREKYLRVPVREVQGAGAHAVAVLDLGDAEARLSLEGARWARRFSPVAATPPPESIADILRPGDVVEIEVPAGWTPGGEVRLSQPPLVQGALVVIEPATREVLALSGGSDFVESPFNRATQARRQPGSAFKPIIYAAAIRSGAYHPASILMDSPEVYYLSGGGAAWKPQNFERTFLGPVTLRFALAHSINTVAVKLISDLGVDKVIQVGRELGIRSPMLPNLSLALGTSEVSPLELTNAYATLAAGGIFAEPVFITAVVRADGERMPLERPAPRPALSPAEAYVLTSMLTDVIEEGTGRRAARLNRPMAGKTGTASDHRDAWFVGFSPDLVAGVWVGFDDHSPLGTSWAQGAGTALPIWIDLMERALRGRPREPFPVPEGVVMARIDPRSGKLAAPQDPEARLEVFVAGTEPDQVAARPVSEPDEEGETPPELPGAGRLPEGLFR